MTKRVHKGLTILNQVEVRLGAANHLFSTQGDLQMDGDDLRKPSEDSNIYMHLLKYKGAYYAAEVVEVTPDTVFFQVDASLVRKGLFPKGRLDMRWFSEMGIELVPVYHAPLLEQ